MKKDFVILGLLAAGIAGLIALQKHQKRIQHTDDIMKRTSPFSSPKKSQESPYCSGGV